MNETSKGRIGKLSGIGRYIENSNTMEEQKNKIKKNDDDNAVNSNNDSAKQSIDYDSDKIQSIPKNP